MTGSSVAPENGGIWEILVPFEQPYGSRLGAEHHQAWNTRVREMVEGIAILKATQSRWMSPEGEFFVEVRVMATRDQMERIAAFTAEHYGRKTVMFYRIASEAAIYHRPENA